MKALPISLGLALALCATAQAPSKEARRAFDKAIAEVKAQRPDDAIRDFEQAVALFPAYSEAWCQLGKLQFTEHQPDAARKSFEAAIHADPKYTAAYRMLAVLEQSARRWKPLIDVTDALLRLDASDYPQAWLLNGVGHYNNHELAAAENSARQAERLDPQLRLPEARRLLGLILAQRGDFAGEAEQFREYLRVAPPGPESDSLRAMLAEASRRAGETATADSAPVFRSETAMAVVRFQIRPNKGQTVHNLLPTDIEVREDGVAQKIALFEGGAVTARTVPVEISLLFDCSSSVERITVLSPNIFRENLLDDFPNVSIAIYGFSDNLVRLARPTRDAAALKRAMDLLSSIPQHSTPLFGSIADMMRDASATGANVIRMALIFSDGESEWPGDENRVDEVVRAAAESGTSLFPVTLTKMGAGGSGESVRDFVGLASATGGKEFQRLMGVDVLPSILKGLGQEIRAGYVAGFYLSAGGRQKRHHIEVLLHSKDAGKLYGGSRTIVY